MNDFVQFLNTTDAETLMKTPGISQALAGNIIAARPFESVEDCLNVRGMGKNLLARLQTSFETAIPSPEAVAAPVEQALVPAEPQAVAELPPAEKKPPVEESKPAPSGPSFGSRLGKAFLWFFRALVRLILIVLVIGGIGAAIYYGVPYFRRTFVAPVEQNAARVTELENEVTALKTRLNEVNSQLSGVNDQLDGLNDQLQDAGSRIDALSQSVEAHTAALEQLEEMDTALETKITETNDLTLLALQNEVTLTRVLDLLARARLYLAQSNFGLAKADVQSARDLLAELQASAADEAQAQAVGRLDLALGNLPDFPVVASGDLEIAWQILMTGEALPTATPEPASTSQPGATPTPTPGATPTP